MGQDEQSDVYQPLFPALESCLLIDPRHSTRQDLRRDIKASNLFENIVEAKSLDDGTRIISAHRFDGVFLGTSLSAEKVLTLLVEITAKSFSKDCAIIVIVARGTPQVQPYLDAGAHRVIEIPCPRSVFMEGVVRAVVHANVNSPWTGIVLNADANGQNLFGEEKPAGAATHQGPTTGGAQQPASPQPASQGAASQPADSQLSRATLNSVIAQSAPGLKQLRKRLEAGAELVEASGAPTPQTRSEIAALLDSILQNTDLPRKAPTFREFFERVLVEWVSDMKVYGPTDATDELRRKLLAYKA